MPGHVIKDILIKFVICVKKSKWLELSALINSINQALNSLLFFIVKKKSLKLLGKGLKIPT